jgi:hypothetical protein
MTALLGPGESWPLPCRCYLQCRAILAVAVSFNTLGPSLGCAHCVARGPLHGRHRQTALPARAAMMMLIQPRAAPGWVGASAPPCWAGAAGASAGGSDNGWPMVGGLSPGSCSHAGFYLYTKIAPQRYRRSGHTVPVTRCCLVAIAMMRPPASLHPD